VLGQRKVGEKSRGGESHNSSKGILLGGSMVNEKQ
jgi:hypothetical protein